MRAFFDDIRYAARSLAASPGFTAVALLTLAIGSGANATVFSFVNATLFRQAPVPNPSSLIAVYTSDHSSGPYGESSYPEFEALGAGVTSFDGLAAYVPRREALFQTEGAVERIRVVAVSADFFSVLGIDARVGRLIAPADLRPDNRFPVAVISDELWGSAFRNKPEALGTTMSLDGRPYTIVGVMPRAFKALDLGERVDVWIPISVAMSSAGRDERFVSIVGRLQRGASLAQAQAEVSAVASRLAADFPYSNRGTLQHPDEPRPMVVLRHTRLPPEFRVEAATLAAIMLGAVMLVLIIACANVANLLLSRAAARRRDIIVRLALGAPRRRVVIQMLNESALLASGGAGLGLLLTLWTSDALPSFFTREQAEILEAGVDLRVLVYTLSVALASSLVFGVAPALDAFRQSAALALRTGTLVTDSRGGARVRTMFVVAQIALATVLLVGAALLLRSLANAINADLGFGARQAVLASLEEPVDRPAVKGVEYYHDVAGRVQGVPGVSAVALANWLPLGRGPRRMFRPEGYTERQGEDLELQYNIVDTGYFGTMQIPIVAGRDFDDRDARTSANVLVNDVLARRFFEGDAVGRTLTDSSGATLTIVGVAGTSKHRSLQEQPSPLVYYPLGPDTYLRYMTIIARPSSDAAGLVSTVRTAAQTADPRVAVYRVITMDAHVRESLSTERMAAALVSVCGGLALALALVGVYGVVRYAVARRTREIGVRVALGAGPHHVVTLVLLDGLRITAFGLSLGLIGAFAAARTLGSMLFGIGTFDVATFAAVGALLSLVTVIASLLPARRALRLNPVLVLRDE